MKNPLVTFVTLILIKWASFDKDDCYSVKKTTA